MPVQDRSDSSNEEWTLNLNVLGPNTLQARNVMFGLADAVNEAPQAPATPILPRRRPGRPSRRELELRNGGTPGPQTPPAAEVRNLQQQIQQQVQQQLQQHLVQLQQPVRQEQGQAQQPITGIRCELCRQLTADTVINPCNHMVCSGCIPRLLSCPTCNRAILPANLIRMRP